MNDEEFFDEALLRIQAALVTTFPEMHHEDQFQSPRMAMCLAEMLTKMRRDKLDGLGDKQLGDKQ